MIVGGSGAVAREVVGKGDSEGLGNLRGCVEGSDVVGVVHSDSVGFEVVWLLVGDGQVVDVEREQTRTNMSVNRTGVIEGQLVHDIVLDTGCTRTMVRRGLLPTDIQTTEQTVQIRCAHEDVTTYPLANIHLEIDGVVVEATAAVSQTLPVSVLLGTDVPQLGQLLQPAPRPKQIDHQALVVTRGQARKIAEGRDENHQKDTQSGPAQPC